MVAWLTEALLARGHEVTLFASGDSACRAPLRARWARSLRETGLDQVGSAFQAVNLGDVYRSADEFDIIHTHVEFWSFPFARLVETPTVSTLHGRLDLPELLPVYRAYPDIPLVSISNDQRRPLPGSRWLETIYHGMPADLLAFSPGPGRYLAFLGRISPEKRPDLAISVARRSGVPLKIAAKIDSVDRAYYEAKIKRLITPPDIEYVGEINDREKGEFLGSALALLFPIDWPEPFGLVMIESLACGTPVIARPCGSAPEIIRDGVTGFLATEQDELVAAIGNLTQLSRHACRRDFEARFTADRMAAEYERLYYDLVAEGGVTRDETARRRVARPTWFNTGS